MLARRIVGGHRHHWHPGRASSAGVQAAREAVGPSQPMHQQYEAVEYGDAQQQCIAARIIVGCGVHAIPSDKGMESPNNSLVRETRYQTTVFGTGLTPIGGHFSRPRPISR